VVIALLAVFFAERVDLHALVSGLAGYSLRFGKWAGVTAYTDLGRGE